MQEKGIRSKDVKNLPPIEEIHGLDNPIQVVEVNSLHRFDESDIHFDKPASLCLDEFDNFVAKQRVSMILLADNWNRMLVCLVI